MVQHARGTFTVTITPQAHVEGVGEATISRMGLHKVFVGELQGTASGQMLAVRTATQGSAGYVAMDRLTGTLQGRRGSFNLQHSGTMTRGAPDLSVTVIPDSGTEELAGIRGTLAIDIREGEHFYHFAYTFD